MLDDDDTLMAGSAPDAPAGLEQPPQAKAQTAMAAASPALWSLRIAAHVAL
jgi:hypothetical protein